MTSFLLLIFLISFPNGAALAQNSQSYSIATTTVRPTTESSGDYSTWTTSSTSTDTTVPIGTPTKKIVWEDKATGNLEIWEVDLLSGVPLSKRRLKPPIDGFRLKSFHRTQSGTYALVWGNGNRVLEWILDEKAYTVYQIPRTRLLGPSGYVMRGETE